MDLSDAPKYSNALHQREVLLRNRRIRHCAQLVELRDELDSIDLVGNQLTELTLQFPKLPRLKTLLLQQNHIRRIDPQFAHCVPNLTLLSLSNNQITDITELQFVSDLPKLTHLVLEGNPVAQLPEYRRQILQLQPRIRFLDFVKVKSSDRPTTDQQEKQQMLLAKLENATSAEEIDAIERELATL